MIDNWKSAKNNFYVYLTIVFFLVLTYFPAITGYYLHTDDYFWSYWGGFPCRIIMNFMTIVGRPMAGLLYCFTKIGHPLYFYNFYRFLSLLNVSLVSYLLFVLLRDVEVGMIAALGMALLVTTMPSFQVYVSFLSTAPYGLAVTLSLLSLIIVRKRTGDVFRKGSVWRNLILAGGILLLALALYQPTAFFCFSVLPIYLIYANSLDSFKDEVKKILRFGGVFALAMIIYYGIWCLWLGMADIPLGGKYDGRILVSNYFGRLLWFMKGPLLEATNLWKIYPSKRFSVATISLCILIFLIYSLTLIRHGEKGNSRKFAYATLKFLLLVFMLPLSYLPVLVSSGPSTEYRTYAPLHAFFLLVLLCGLYRISVSVGRRWHRNLVSGIVCGMAIYCAFWANYHVSHFFSIPDSKEICYIKEEVEKYRETKGDSFTGVNIITVESAIAPSQRNEIGEPSARHGPNIRPLVETALSELGISKPIQVTHCERGNTQSWALWSKNLSGLGLSVSPVPARPDVIVIDMNKVSRDREGKK